MKVVFRVDASVSMGTGHVIRCLTLADALATQGARCFFICRELPGHLIAHVRGRGYHVHVLAMSESSLSRPTQRPASADGSRQFYSALLGVSQEQDARESLPFVQEICPDWLVVDHYALDMVWETMLLSYSRKLLVIDDLADRDHQCDLLLDQTYGCDDDIYRKRVPAQARLLCGAHYALLRPEFAALRDYSLARRLHAPLRQVVISMGGTDQD
ncbi:MAG TPA: UDP-2,4-diacetamido-2,4,6-trideoxy-beta-L-altropyranose hydrolase, partial [Dongiaceae bacterium]|nr:UDP-2,4-diacetamido-2,4,6-trideoxy-beta-L-altropyranose hydrolase [Dongiaceae bacterium]